MPKKKNKQLRFAAIMKSTQRLVIFDYEIKPDGYFEVEGCAIYPTPYEYENKISAEGTPEEYEEINKYTSAIESLHKSGNAKVEVALNF